MVTWLRTSVINGVRHVQVPIDTYNKLWSDSHQLQQLKAAGVDNWEGYSEAIGDNYEDDVPY